AMVLRLSQLQARRAHHYERHADSRRRESGDSIQAGMNNLRVQQGATAVVLLHGMFGSPENWRGCADELSENFCVVVPQLPLFDAPLEAAALNALVNFVRARLDVLGISRAIVAGNSLGGHVAARLALQEPQRVSALVLTGSSGLFEKSV